MTKRAMLPIAALVGALAAGLVPSAGKAADPDTSWYIVSDPGPSCIIQNSGTLDPVGTIQMIQSLGQQVLTTDVADPETGAITQTTIHVARAGHVFDLTFYRGYERCKAALKVMLGKVAARDAANQQVLDRYK